MDSSRGTGIRETNELNALRADFKELNIEHPTLNVEKGRKDLKRKTNFSYFDVGRSMFDVGRSVFSSSAFSISLIYKRKKWKFLYNKFQITITECPKQFHYLLAAKQVDVIGHAS
ncbi:MAG: hypothetical protein HZA01_03590 [Nitrospinae bacterium]|nr:hypothetical protein [Nitrospinota bacterium]